MQIPTIKVETDGGKDYKIINKDDFDPKIHKEYQPKPAKAAAKEEKK